MAKTKRKPLGKPAPRTDDALERMAQPVPADDVPDTQAWLGEVAAGLPGADELWTAEEEEDD